MQPANYTLRNKKVKVKKVPLCNDVDQASPGLVYYYLFLFVFIF